MKQQNYHYKTLILILFLTIALFLYPQTATAITTVWQQSNNYTTITNATLIIPSTCGILAGQTYNNAFNTIDANEVLANGAGTNYNKGAVALISQTPTYNFSATWKNQLNTQRYNVVAFLSNESTKRGFGVTINGFASAGDFWQFIEWNATACRVLSASNSNQPPFNSSYIPMSFNYDGTRFLVYWNNLLIFNLTNQTNLNNVPIKYIQFAMQAYSSGTASIKDMQFNETTPSVPTSALVNITLINQTPASITFSTLFSQNALAYYLYNGTNWTSPQLNLSIYRNSGSTCLSRINGTCTLTNNTMFVNNPTTWTNTSNDSTISYTFTENQIYPTIANLNYSYFIPAHTQNTLTTSARMVKTEIINFSNQRYNILEVMANTTSTGYIYLCNTTYTTGNVYSSPYCQQLATLTNTIGYNHTHGTQSSHTSFPFGIINGKLDTSSGIGVTDTMYLVIGGVANYYTVANNSRTGATQTSINSGLTWSSETYSLDFHIHVYSTDTYIKYFAYGLKNGIYENSSDTTSQISIANLFPTIPSITNPPSGTQTLDQYLNISWTASLPQSIGAVIQNYTITIINLDGNNATTNSSTKIIKILPNTTTSYYWDIWAELIPSGNYELQVSVNDSYGQTRLDSHNIVVVANRSISTWELQNLIQTMNITLTNQLDNLTNITQTNQNILIQIWNYLTGWITNTLLGLNNTVTQINNTVNTINQTVNIILNQTNTTLYPATIISDTNNCITGSNWVIQAQVFDQNNNNYPTANCTINSTAFGTAQMNYSINTSTYIYTNICPSPTNWTWSINCI